MEKWMQYAAKINSQIAAMFNEDCENYISPDDMAENAEEFFHALATIAPAMVYNKLCNENLSGLDFNHVANTLCFQYSKMDKDESVDRE